jgi:hypothetical protein
MELQTESQTPIQKQTIVQKLAVLFGVPLVRYVFITLLVVVVWGIYDVRCFHNMSAPEAMDAAQLGHNLASGRGFTTDFVRPLSIYLVRQKNTDRASKDPAQLKTGQRAGVSDRAGGFDGRAAISIRCQFARFVLEHL